MKIVAFAASNHKQSINRKLVEYAANRAAAKAKDACVEYLDLNDYEMPIYSIDRQNADGIHPLAMAFYEKLGTSSALIVSFAEYNGQASSAWKNVFDWASRIDMKVWQNKPVVMLAAAPGARAGASVLGTQTELAPHFGADLRGSHGVGTWSDAWDNDAKSLTKQSDIDAIDRAIDTLIA